MVITKQLPNYDESEPLLGKYFSMGGLSVVREQVYDASKDVTEDIDKIKAISALKNAMMRKHEIELKVAVDEAYKCGLSSNWIWGDSNLIEAENMLSVLKSIQTNFSIIVKDARGVSMGWMERYRAFRELKTTAESGYVEGAYYLGKIYYEGIGSPRSSSKALEWFTIAAQKGHVKSQRIIGYLYKRGFGTSIDYTIAVKWLKKAAENKDPKAMCILGDCYSKGHGVKKDYSYELKWYEDAAYLGYTPAENYMGIHYIECGEFEEALKWFKKTSDKGDPEGQFELGYIYYKGLDIDTNKEKGMKLLQKLHEQGYVKATKFLEYIDLRIFRGNDSLKGKHPLAQPFHRRTQR